MPNIYTYTYTNSVGELGIESSLNSISTFTEITGFYTNLYAGGAFCIASYSI